MYVSHPLLSLPEYCSELTPHNFSQQYVYDNDVLFSNNSDGNVTGESNMTNNEIRRMSILLKEEGPINQPNTALFCTILALGTFFIAYYLRQFRNSKFLGRSVSTSDSAQVNVSTLPGLMSIVQRNFRPVVLSVILECRLLSSLWSFSIILYRAPTRKSSRCQRVWNHLNLKFVGG